jgi:hypothetical protein
MVPGRCTPHGGRATERAKTPPDARARVRCSWSTSTILSVSRIDLIDLHIDTLGPTCEHGNMAYTNTTLVLGGTGKTGARVAARLTRFGLPVKPPPAVAPICASTGRM